MPRMQAGHDDTWDNWLQDDDDSRPQLPERLMRYGTPVPVGKGSTGTVYKMVPPTEVVAKAIECGRDAARLDEALYEVRIMRHLSDCPHVVRLVDSEIVAKDGRHTVYLVEEYCTPLTDVLRSRTLSPTECIDLALGVTDALEECRRRGILHLDVQPKNVFLAKDGCVKLGDFGSSLFESDLHTRTRLRGTLAFMAPEAFRERQYGVRSDIYSVGMLLYYLLNGARYPFADASSASEASYRMLAGEELPRLAGLDDELNDVLFPVLRQICSFDAAHRPASFQELEGSLAALKERIAHHDEPVSTPSRRVLPLIFVVDASEGKARKRIHAVNHIMSYMPDLVRDAERRQPDTDVRVGVLSFASEAQWTTRDAAGRPCLVRGADVTWRCEARSGHADLRRALDELDSQLSRRALLKDFDARMAPVVILLSDGLFEDDWQDALSRALKDNKWLGHATRLCVATTDDINVHALACFAGSPEGVPNYEVVFRSGDLDHLSRALRFVSVTASSLESSVHIPQDASDFSAMPWPGYDDFDAWGSFTAHDSATPPHPSVIPSMSSRFDWEPSPHEDWLFDADPIATSVALTSLNSIASPLSPGTTVVLDSDESSDDDLRRNTLTLDKVSFSVVAPKAVERDEYTVIDMFVYEQAFRGVVDQLKDEALTQVQERQSGHFTIGRKSLVKVALSSRAIPIEDGEQEMTWEGGFLEFSFDVLIPADYARSTIPFSATVYVNGVAASNLRFVVKCSTQERQEPEVVRHDIRSAFVSYASADRDRVIALVQGMRAARQDLDIFFDVESLRVGEDWERRILQEVEHRDVLYLCWSRSARASKYVDLEWRHAFETKGIEFIEPVPIEPPTVCPPPDELKGKHFNDMLLYLLSKRQEPSWSDEETWSDVEW